MDKKRDELIDAYAMSMLSLGKMLGLDESDMAIAAIRAHDIALLASVNETMGGAIVDMARECADFDSMFENLMKGDDGNVNQ